MTKSIFQDYEQQIISLGVRYVRFYKMYDKIKKWLDLPEGQKQSIERRRFWIERLERPEFPVAFLGSFSAGKSTIINAVIGREILPENMKVFTAIPTLIKKGTEDKAVVYYLNQEERRDLFNLWVREIEQKLKRALPHCSPEDKPVSVIADIKAALNTLDDPDINVSKELNRLELLAQKWETQLLETPIGIEELANYVTEDYSDVFLVSRVEVSLKDVHLENGVVLVDLPGLNVVNPLHKKITKEYIEREAKAFVICMKPDGLLEGDEISMLEEVYRQNPRILQRAFWVLNKWDGVNHQQKRETEQAFDEKMTTYGFSIAEERLFQVSALNHLLLRYLSNGNLQTTRKLKEHIDNLSKYGTPYKQIDKVKADEMLQSIPEVVNFEQFNAALIDYLQHTARLDFIQDAKGEFNSMLSIIGQQVEHMASLIHLEGRNSEQLKFMLATKELDELSNRLKETIEAVALEVRIDEKIAQQCWPATVQQEINNLIVAKIKSLDKRELKNELYKGLDQGSMMSRLHPAVEKRLGIQQLLRTKLKQQIGQIIRARLSEQLINKLMQVTPIPSNLMKELKALLTPDVIDSRIDGLADALYAEYGDRIDQIAIERKFEKGSNQPAAKTTADGDIDSALNTFQQEVISFVKDLAAKTNLIAPRLIKNFAEGISIEAPDLIDKHKASFTPLVMERADLNEVLHQEEAKRAIFHEASEVIKFLTSDWQSPDIVDDSSEMN